MEKKGIRNVFDSVTLNNPCEGTTHLFLLVSVKPGLHETMESLNHELS